MSKPDRRTVIRGIAIFILLPLLIGIFMYTRMLSMLHTYMEDQVADQARVLSQLALRRLSVRLSELEVVAGYLEDSELAERDMGAAIDGLLENPSMTSNGVVRLDGSAVSGKSLNPEEYPAVRSAFRGTSTVRYREGEGLLFTAPVYHNGNVKYVLYEFFDHAALFAGFGSAAFDGRAGLMLADSSRQISIPISEGGLTAGDPFFQTDRIRDAIGQLTDRLNTDSTAAVYCADKTHLGSEEFVFVSVLSQARLYLVGIIPHEAVAGELGSLSGMAILVYGLLLALLVIGTFRIVSTDARARESDELRRAKQVAEEASESKGRFLSSMSHELRTPINTIMGMNEMVLRETREEDTRERSMDIKSASQILLGLINDVLDFSKIESGRLSIIPVEYDLTKLVRDLVLLSENRAMSKSLEFKLDIDPDLPVGLYGDDIRLQQVVINLLTNAVKYTMGGSVTLRMSGQRVEDDKLILRCEVSDTGIGIKPEDIEKLMRLDPFTRIEETRNRKVEGSGLGLPIIINLLRLMGSELRIESVYGQGSTFSFDLEQRIVDPQPMGDIRQRLADGVKAYEYRVTCIAPEARVLVVDDNAMNRKIFVSLLKPTRIQVDAASSGAKCLELVKHEHYDLIFMDHLMPDMDGVETLQHLREQEENLCRETPVIALTANAFSGAREKYMEMGFDAFLAKPIVAEKLEAMLVDMLPKKYLQPIPEGEPDPGQRAEPGSGEEQVELPVIEGVNWEFALLHIGDHALLLGTLKDFYQSIRDEMETVRALSEQVDTEDGLSAYRTRVHALKSTSAMVGILSVSEVARLLEAAARAGETEKIRTLTPILLELLSQTEERIRPFMDEGEKLPAPDSEKLFDLLQMLRCAMEDMDITAADSAMTQLNRYRYPDEVQTHIDELSALEASLSFDEAQELVERLLEEQT